MFLHSPTIPLVSPPETTSLDSLIMGDSCFVLNLACLDMGLGGAVHIGLSFSCMVSVFVVIMVIMLSRHYSGVHYI